MRVKSKLIASASIALVLLPASTLVSAPPPTPSTNLEQVLHKLDVAAANFHSASAHFEFDEVQNDPVPSKDSQTGTVYYERNGNAVRMAAHIDRNNGKPAPKVYTYANGVFKLYEAQINQVTTFTKWSRYESYLLLGFGASGKDLAQKWDIKYVGEENLPEGKASVKTEKLELIAKDPTVRKNIPKVTLWMDADRGISLKQVFDEGSNGYRVCVYFDLALNKKLSGNDFEFKTGPHPSEIKQ